MDLRQEVYLASESELKVDAVHMTFKKVHTRKTRSGVPEQPYGRAQIRKGAENRLDGVPELYAISLETGIVEETDSTCCLLRTPVGFFEDWRVHRMTDSQLAKLEIWLSMPNREQTTLGSLIDPENPTDWYNHKCSGISRCQLMSIAAEEAVLQYEAYMRSLPLTVLPAPVIRHKGVPFLDIQYPLLKYPKELSEIVWRLSDGILFNKVVVLDARGFLMCGEYARRGYPIVLARKEDKLPGKTEHVEYKKEYGTDSLYIESESIQRADCVLIIDDVIASGGTMLAAASLIEKMGGKVAGFIAPYAIETEPGVLMCNNNIRKNIRFLCTQTQAAEAMVSGPSKIVSYQDQNNYRFRLIFPPSLYVYDKRQHAAPIEWGRFARSPNIWFDGKKFANNQVFVFMDPSNEAETFNVLQLVSILHRKDPKEIMIVIPFLEQGTQDRIEYSGNMQSLALVDTISNMIGKTRVLTFDLHAEQSQFAFRDLRFENLVPKLWELYLQHNKNSIVVFPDDGAAKRYSKLLNLGDRQCICFRKIRKGDARVVSTDSQIVPNMNYVIVDDLVRSGGTMNEVAKYLFEHKAANVDALFTHAPLESNAAKNMALFREIWTTNTCPREVPRSWVKLNIYEFVLSMYADRSYSVWN